MSHNTDFKGNYIFSVPVCDNWLIHAPLYKTSALINRGAVKSLKNISKNYKLYELRNIFSRKPEYVPSHSASALSPDFIGIIPTRSCNFKCIYCSFGSSEKSHIMEPHTASSVVEWMVEYIKERGSNKCEVHFFGGEPFFAPQIVSIAVHKTILLCEKYKLRPVFKVTTNGYFDEKTCKFAGNYFDTIVLSVDGTEDIQNKYRPLQKKGKTYDIIARNAIALSKSSAELCLRVCVTSETVNKLNKITDFLCSSFHPSSIDFEVLISNKETDKEEIFPPDPWVFAENYAKASSIASSYGVNAIYSPASINSIHHSFCPVGKDVPIISPEGLIRACYLQEEEWLKKGLNLTFGQIEKSGKMNINYNDLEKIRNLTDEKKLCSKCIARWHCAGGCHVNHYHINSAEEYDNFCIQTRIITVYNLLTDLGCRKEAEQFISDRKNLEIMALNKSDLLEDWREMN